MESSDVILMTRDVINVTSNVIDAISMNDVIDVITVNE